MSPSSRTCCSRAAICWTSAEAAASWARRGTRPGTPGHTPGHISLYLPEHGTVITGDAMVLENSLPAVANPEFAYSLPDAQRSLKRLLALDAKTYICCHGGVYRR